MGPVSVLLPPDVAEDKPFLFILDEMLFHWREPRPGLLRVHAMEHTPDGVVLVVSPTPRIAFRDAAEAAREAPLDERIAWGATRIVDACRAVSTLSGPHRSLSPRTLAFDVEGRAVVMPAITRVFDHRARTGAGRIRGIVGYLTPEAVKGLPLDARSDVYQLAHLLRGLLGARPLFKRDTELASLQAILAREPIPRLCDEGIDVPAALDDAIHAALAYDVAARPSSVDALAAALLPFCDDARARESAIPKRAREKRAGDDELSPLTALFEGPILKPCRKQWDELDTTDATEVRHCSECDRSVQRARTTLELVMIGGGCAFWDPKRVDE
jgi:serine/threonine protein kinase